MKAALFLLLPLSVHATTFYVTLAGLGGEPDYEQRFTGWAKDLDQRLKDSGMPSRVFTLYGPDATRAKLESTLAEVQRAARPEDALVLMLIGHGSYDGVDYKVNLPGPDISGVQIAALLDRVPAKRQLVVNMTSASGGCMNALEKPGRLLIVATKSGYEKNATVFARYWVEALRDPSTDTDKNGTVSALEAYRYATRKTAAFYEEQKRIATEHPQLDENTLAENFPLLRLTSDKVTSPAKQQLLEKKEQLENDIDQLKYRKAALPADEYKSRLTELLLNLARTQQELDK